MNLREVQRVLNEMFQKELINGQKRQLVFWYDEKGEFIDDVPNLELDNVRIWTITKNNLFATKYELEKVDPDSHFLLYANMAKPAAKEDWLLDQYKMGTEFATDKITVIMREIGVVDDSIRPAFEKYAKFFNNQKRLATFQSYAVTSYTEEILDVTVLAALTKSPLNTLDDVMRSLLRELASHEQGFWHEIEKYGADQPFWLLVEKYYGYSLDERSLESFMRYLMITYLAERMPEMNFPESWRKYISTSPLNVIVFMNHFMNHNHDQKWYQLLADEMANSLHLKDYLPSWEVTDILEADAFRQFDEHVLTFLQQQLLSDVDQFDLYREIISKRRLLAWYQEYQFEYEAIEQVIKLTQFSRDSDLFLTERSSYEWFQSYCEEYFAIDTAYRKFYSAYDRLENKERLASLQEKVENFYANAIMPELAAKWTGSLERDSVHDWPLSGIDQQAQFYRTYIQPYISKDERVFVIISDALRFEAAKELLNVLNNERKASTELTALQSVIPSYTDLGMAALLPHKVIEYDQEAVIVDGLRASSTINRNKILNNYVTQSLAITYKEISQLKRPQFREILTGKKLVYIYHNTIDARGDNKATEIEVFEGVDDAIRDISSLVNQLVNNVSASTIFITADHGFLYQRKALNKSDKMPKEAMDAQIVKKRFILSDRPLQIEGTLHYSLEGMISQKSPIYATIPKGSSRFAIQGPGANYVHGGAMLQEIVIPVITFKNDRSASTKNNVSKVDVKLTSPLRKITNPVTYLEFFQINKVEEKKQPLHLRLFFIDELGERISNESIIIADSTSNQPEDRIQKVKFLFKRISYDKRATFYLVLEDEKAPTKLIIEKIAYSIDLP